MGENESMMLPMGAISRRWVGVLLAVIYAFCLGEALMPEACDGDARESTVVALSHSSSGLPSPASQGHDGPHVCHCAHTTGVLNDAPPRLGASMDERELPIVFTPAAPLSRTLQPDFRPPIA